MMEKVKGTISRDHIVYNDLGNPEIHAEDVKTVYDITQKAGELFGDKVFLRYERDDVVYEKSYAQYAQAAKAFAAWAKDKSQELGHPVRVSLVGQKGYTYLAVLFGITGAGGVSIPLDVQLANPVMADTINRADTDVVFYDWEYGSQISYMQDNCPGVKEYICLQRMKKEASAGSIQDTYEGVDFTPEAKEDQCALIIYTSGTTGLSKGVMLSHRNLVSNVFCNDEFGDRFNEIALGALPINHVFCINEILMVMRYGCTFCLLNDMKKLFHSLTLFQPHYMRSVPMVLKAINSRLQVTEKRNPGLSKDEVREEVLGKNMYKLTGGGGYLAPELAESLKAYSITVGQGYGMTECSPKLAVPDYGWDEKLSSVGYVVRGVDARVQDGELQVKGPNVMMGYYNDEERTAEAFTEDGYLKTGDLCYIDEDGFVFLTGRKKNLIILSNGENVSPEAIENLFDSDVLISDIMVYAEDEKILAEVYPNYEYASANGIKDIEGAVQTIVDGHNEDMPTYSRIASVKVRQNPFKKTSSRKILRDAVFTEKKEAQRREQDKKKPENELQQTLYDIISEILGNDKFGVDDNLNECGMDSMSSILLIEEIEARTKKVISYNDLASHRTIRELEALLRSLEDQEQVVHEKLEVYPLTSMQMYFGYIIKGNTTGNLPFTFALHEKTDLERLQEAIKTVINAHPGVKGIIKPDEKHILWLHRRDEDEVDVPIIKLTEAQWQEEKEKILVPFKYTEDDRLYHIAIYETEEGKYLLFDVAHIMGDGITMNILLEDVSKAYQGLPIQEEKYTFYDYILDERAAIEAGARKETTDYYDSLLNGSRLNRSVLNKKGKQNLNHADQDAIRKDFDKLTMLKVKYFCRENGISENVLFLTAFNYTVGIFSNEKDLFTSSIHSGRTNGSWRRLAGPLFKTYFVRTITVPHETTIAYLKRIGKQVMDTMRCPISVPREGEMFFQYQGDIINIHEIGGLPAKPIHLQLDSLPFHMQVMARDTNYFTELRFWKNRFDRDQMDLFLDCYESVVDAMLSEPSARCLKKHLPEKAFPKHYYVTAGELNREAGFELIPDAADDEKIKAYVLDDRYARKPYGAWGRLYIMDREPAGVKDTVNNPFRDDTTLYDTGLEARIMLNGEIDFLENSGRTVLTDGHLGRRYYDLGQLEQVLGMIPQVGQAEGSLVYDRNLNEMKLEMNVHTAQDSFINMIRNYAGEKCGQDMVPAVVNIMSEE